MEVSKGASAPRLLLAHADAFMAERLRLALEDCGLRVDGVRHLAGLREALARRRYDGALLAADLPGGAARALELVRELGALGVTVLVGAAALQPDDRIRLLQAGADDCIPDAVEPREVAARVQALLRRARQVRRAAAELVHGALRLRLDDGSVNWHGQPVALTPMERRVLEVLVRAAPRTVSREALEERLHGPEGPGRSNAVQVHVHHLRRKLGRDLIRTVHGAGYQIAPAPRLADDSSDPAQSAVE